MNKPTEFAYRALLRDLAHQEPRIGYTSIADFDLTTHQIATVIDHFPELVAEAIGDKPYAFGIVLTDPTPENCQLYCSLILTQVRHEAKQYIFGDLLAECEEKRQANHNDDKFHRRVL